MHTTEPDDHFDGLPLTQHIQFIRARIARLIALINLVIATNHELGRMKSATEQDTLREQLTALTLNQAFTKADVICFHIDLPKLIHHYLVTANHLFRRTTENSKLYKSTLNKFLDSFFVDTYPAVYDGHHLGNGFMRSIINSIKRIDNHINGNFIALIACFFNQRQLSTYGTPYQSLCESLTSLAYTKHIRRLLNSLHDTIHLDHQESREQDEVITECGRLLSTLKLTSDTQLMLSTLRRLSAKLIPYFVSQTQISDEQLDPPSTKQMDLLFFTYLKALALFPQEKALALQPIRHVFTYLNSHQPRHYHALLVYLTANIAEKNTSYTTGIQNLITELVHKKSNKRSRDTTTPTNKTEIQIAEEVKKARIEYV